MLQDSRGLFSFFKTYSTKSSELGLPSKLKLEVVSSVPL